MYGIFYLYIVLYCIAAQNRISIATRTSFHGGPQEDPASNKALIVIVCVPHFFELVHTCSKALNKQLRLDHSKGRDK